jgi:hypothetical protein
MPYAIIGVISVGLVITSIRTVVVERAHIRKRLVGLILRKQDKRLKYLKRRVQLYVPSNTLIQATCRSGWSLDDGHGKPTSRNQSSCNRAVRSNDSS